MNFINRLSFNPLSVTQEPQSEVPSTPTPEPQEPTSLGVGSSPDLFETAVQNQFDRSLIPRKACYYRTG